MSTIVAPPSTGTTLEELIRTKTARVGVIGLGYVGLPLVQAFIKAGYETLGYDVDQSKVDCLLAGQSYIRHIQPEWISDCIEQKKFAPTADMAPCRRLTPC